MIDLNKLSKEDAIYRLKEIKGYLSRSNTAVDVISSICDVFDVEYWRFIQMKDKNYFREGVDRDRFE